MEETVQNNVGKDRLVKDFFESFDEANFLIHPKEVKVVRDVGSKSREYSTQSDIIMAYCYFEPWDWVIGVIYNCKDLGSAQSRIDLMLDRTLGLVCAVALVISLNRLSRL
ncbi:MAG: hypothetical protein JRG71_09980 [Deltaproteobacteria bacterium]|nr:hypothetical protein [Deltaproteobacteria bacterium]